MGVRILVVLEVGLLLRWSLFILNSKVFQSWLWVIGWLVVFREEPVSFCGDLDLPRLHFCYLTHVDQSLSSFRGTLIVLNFVGKWGYLAILRSFWSAYRCIDLFKSLESLDIVSFNSG